jgi:tetratricopeptide (TPR) repeat protein
MLTKQVTCPVLVGRKNELQALIEMLERAVSGRGDTVLIAGDAGIGKSRLCRELKREATARGIRLIQGHCSMAESAVPYGPFMDALRFRLERGDGMAVAQLLGPLLRYLAPLFPELPAGGATAGELSEGPAERAFEAIGQVLQRLAELGPLLLLLEDFHWADPTSRDLLYFLSRRVGDLPLLIVLTCRSDELHLGHPVRRLSAMLTRERLAREITLAPLTEPEVGEMVAAILETVPDPELVAAAATRTEGNPFFVEELIKGMSEAGAPGASGAMEVVRAGLPATISEVIVGRVEPLGSRAREVLSVAAVIGRTFSFDLLREVSGVEEEELLEVVEQLVTAQLLVEEHGPSGERYAFRHGLIHEVFYNDIIAPRRRFWHRRVAAALEAQASGSLLVPYEPLAYHSRLGGDAARAGEYALLAGDQAARLFAWRDAEARYQEALAALEPGEESAAREAAILARLSYVAWCQSRMDDSQRHAEQALELRRGLRDHRGAAALLRRLAFLYAHQRGEWERAATCLREAIGLVAGEADGTEETLATVDLGRLCLERGLYDEAEAALERGLALASRYDGSGEEALALASLGLLAVHRGAVRAGVVRLDLALTLMVDRPLPLDRASGVFRAGIRALEAAREHERALACTVRTQTPPFTGRTARRSSGGPGSGSRRSCSPVMPWTNCVIRAAQSWAMHCGSWAISIVCVVIWRERGVRTMRPVCTVARMRKWAVPSFCSRRAKPPQPRTSCGKPWPPIPATIAFLLCECSPSWWKPGFAPGASTVPPPRWSIWSGRSADPTMSSDPRLLRTRRACSMPHGVKTSGHRALFRLRTISGSCLGSRTRARVFVWISPGC